MRVIWTGPAAKYLPNGACELDWEYIENVRKTFDYDAQAVYKHLAFMSTKAHWEGKKSESSWFKCHALAAVEG